MTYPQTSLVLEPLFQGELQVLLPQGPTLGDIRPRQEEGGALGGPFRTCFEAGSSFGASQPPQVGTCP